MPDEVLQTELGLTPDDRVHTIRISTDTAERADPASVTVEPGDYVQFVTADHFVHEVAFALDSLSVPGRAFLERTEQGASPPLLEIDQRFVVSFTGAPEGRYPYSLAGNRADGAGEVVVAADPG
jgi:plastocyanin